MGLLLKNMQFFRSLSAHPKLPQQFFERILLAVTSVNDCPYCSFFHTKMALEAGCNEQEISSILGGDLSCADSEEIPALAFAQHFADSHEMPSRKSIKELLRYYGFHRTKQILAACWMITMGNLYGNTVDAYRYRLLGAQIPHGNRLFEAILYYSSIKFLNKLK